MAQKILIVEDDSDFQAIYSLYLRGESFEVRTASNGKEGLAALEKETPDLIILDLIMPVMDGEEFYARMRGEAKWRQIPVLIASVNENMPQKIKELGGVAGNLRKPFGIDALLQKIRANLK
jgi:two-component system response regulator VicR